MDYRTFIYAVNQSLDTSPGPYQPFLEEMTKNTLVTSYNPNVLKRGIKYAEFITHMSDTETYKLCLVPDSSITFLFCCNQHRPSCQIIGPRTELLMLELQPDSLYFYAYPYTPLGMKNYFFKPSELFNSVTDYANIFQCDLMPYKVISANSFGDRVEIFERWSLSFLFDYSYHSSIVDYCTSYMCMVNRNADMHDLEYLTGYSHTYIRKCFQAVLGITPKKYQTNLRFQQALRMLAHNESILDTVNQSNYYDQSHLYKAFYKLTGQSPLQFIQGAK